MTVYYMKLKNGEELLVENVVQATEPYLLLVKPVSINYDDGYGMVAKYWVAYGKSNDIEITADNVMIYLEASEKATGYYKEFIEQISAKNTINKMVSDSSSDDDIFDSEFDYPMTSSKIH